MILFDIEERVPQNAYVALGIDSEGEFYKLAWNIGGIELLNSEQRQRILKRADEELPKDVIRKADKLIEDLAYDKEVYEIAGIPYHNGPPEGQKIFRTAVFDYLLRERPFESRT